MYTVLCILYLTTNFKTSRNTYTNFNHLYIKQRYEFYMCPRYDLVNWQNRMNNEMSIKCKKLHELVADGS